MTDNIDVWRIRPLRRAGDFLSLKAILPAEELSRADRQANEAKRRAWVTSRAVVRLLLAHYTHIPANEIRLVAGQNGKPYLDHSQNPHGITFNFSDSFEMALLAVGWNREVGVDIERIRPVDRAMEIADRRFPSETAAELSRADDKDRSRLFLQTWARHEALLKAKAGTIWNPEGGSRDRRVTLSEPRIDRAPSDYTVRDVETGVEYVGALAVQGGGWSLEMKDYSD